MLPTVLRRWSWCYSYFVWLCGFYCGAFHVETCSLFSSPFEPWQDKTNKVSVCPVKTQISLGICPVWSGSSLSAWRDLGSLATHWAHCEDSDQTGQTPKLIWVFAGHTVTLLVLSRGDSFGIWITSLWEERARLCAYCTISLFCTHWFFVLFLFLLVSGVLCGLWLWHSLDIFYWLFWRTYKMSHVMRKPVFAICKQQRCRSAWCIQNLKPLASFCSQAGQFESYLVANSGDSFSRDKLNCKYWDVWNYSCNYPKIWTGSFKHTPMHPKDAGGRQRVLILIRLLLLVWVYTVCSCLSAPIFTVL